MRDRLARNLAPIFLRAVLGITFLWAGLGKFMADMPVQGEDAAILANLGIITPKAKAVPDAATLPEAIALTPAMQPPQTHGLTADDFPEQIQVKRLYGIAILLHKAAHPAATEDGKARRALWPAILASGDRLKAAAWAAALVEVGAGVGVLLGLLTIPSSFALAVVMATAIWLTQIGPAMQAGGAKLGFLPNYNAFAAEEWKPLLWQFSLLGAASALTLLGSGGLSLDRVLFGKGGKPGSPPPKPAA